MIRDIFKVKTKFVDIQRELSIRPGANIDETLKSALLQEKGYVTSNNLQKNLSSSTSENLFRIKQEPNMSIQLRNKIGITELYKITKIGFQDPTQVINCRTQSEFAISAELNLRRAYGKKCSKGGNL